MMTAEQFWFDGHVCKQHKNACCDECMQHVARAEAYAAAQLAEKEREMQKTIDLLDSQLGESMTETKAAEQRLQEAQVRALSAEESLRQREAELEQAQAEIEIRDELINVIKGESPVAPLIERLQQRRISVRDRLPDGSEGWAK